MAELRRIPLVYEVDWRARWRVLQQQRATEYTQARERLADYALLVRVLEQRLVKVERQRDGGRGIQISSM